MLITDLKTAIRSLRRYAGTTTLNAAGLIVGLTACVLIATYVRHELRVDNFQSKADRIVRLNKRVTPQEGGTEHHAITSGKMGPTLAAEYASVEQSVRVLPWFDDMHLQHDNTQATVTDVVFADSNFFSVFDFDLLRGDPASVLEAPNAIVLTESTARRLFGNTNPIGETLEYGRITCTVTGIAADPPQASHIRFNALISWATTVPNSGGLDFDWLNNWTTQVVYTYLVLSPDADRAALAAGFDDFMERHMPDRADQYHLYLQSFSDIYLGSADLRFTRGLRLGNGTYVWGLAVIALLILAIACVNVMNLASAQALRRRREVGVRKALGAGPGQVVRQLIAETFLLSAGSMAAAILLAHATLPTFATLVDRPLSLSALHEPWLWMGSLVLVVTTTLASGLYPALALTRIGPSQALMGRDHGGRTRSRPQKVLVTLQFAAAIVLIAGTAVVYQQLLYVQTKDLGFDAEQVVTMPIHVTDIADQTESFEEELKRHPSVSHVSVSGLAPGEGASTFEIHPEGRPDSEEWQAQGLRVVDTDFFDTYDMAMVAGRPFAPDRGLDSTRAVIVNETLVRAVGWDSPGAAIGKRLDVEGEVRDGVVIGVVKDFHVESLHRAISPLVMWMAPRTNVVSVRFVGNDVSAVVDHLRETWRAFEPSYPFEYTFVDDQFAEAYRTEHRMLGLLGGFAGLAILVACLGLLGLAAYAARRREKEVGIRKALGATVAQIVGLLTKDFVTLVAVAFVLSVPVTYWAARQWLQDFAYHIDLGPSIFVVAGALVLLVAVATVSTQALRAARTDPATVLRSE